MQSFEERVPSNRPTNHAICLLLLLCVVWTQKLCAQNEWSNWRGPKYNGSSDSARPPVSWNSEKNIQWKVELEGLGSSTPVVWQNQVFILTALKTERVENVPSKAGVQASREETERRGRPQIRGAIRDEGPGFQEGGNPGNQPPLNDRGHGPEKSNGRGGSRMSNPPPQNIYEFKITSYDLNTGNKLWQSTVAEEVPHEGGHSTNTFASASPITDGTRIYIFWGSRGVFCLDMQGKKIWNVDFGQQTTRAGFGEGSSAALSGNILVVPWDHEGESFIAALDTRTGDLKWKTSREERTTWSTPLIVSEGERTQVVTNGRRVRSYDLKDGSMLWECGGQTENPIPSPIVFGDTVIATTGFRGSACYAIALNSLGDVTNSDSSIRWRYNQNTPYVPSATLYKDRIYFLAENRAILTSLNARNGEPLYAAKRLNGLGVIYSSIGAADDRLYITDRYGVTVVLKAGESPEVLSTNELGEEVDASLVFVGQKLLLRSNKNLFCIAEQN